MTVPYPLPLQALAQRHRLHEPAHRCAHLPRPWGRYPGCEQWTLDAYPPVFVLTSFLPATDETDAQLAAIGQALAERWAVLAPGQPLNWVFQCRNEALRTQGRTETRLMQGEVPDPHVVTENGARFKALCCAARTMVYFLDMAEGRRWCASMPRPAGKTATAFGAQPVCLHLRVFSGGIAGWGQTGGQCGHEPRRHGHWPANHQLNGITTGASFLAHDIFSSWGKITRSGPYGLVIVDPPSYQRAASSPPKTTPTSCAACPTCWHPAATPCCA